MTRLGDFWKLLATNLLTKVAQNLKIIAFKVNLLWLLFGHLCEIFGLLLFQHLVTLSPSYPPTYVRTLEKQLGGSRLTYLIAEKVSFISFLGMKLDNHFLPT